MYCMGLVRSMTPADLRAWRTHMAWSQNQAADKLGITQQVYSRHERGEVKIDRRTALACAALSAGLGPWMPPEQSEQAEQAGWALGDYDNDDTACPNCGRFRLCLCPNGKHRCEKCNWSPELGNYAPSFD